MYERGVIESASDVFYLELSELLSTEAPQDLKRIVAERKSDFEKFKDVAVHGIRNTWAIVFNTTSHPRAFISNRNADFRGRIFGLSQSVKCIAHQVQQDLLDAQSAAAAAQAAAEKAKAGVATAEQAAPIAAWLLQEYDLAPPGSLAPLMDWASTRLDQPLSATVLPEVSAKR